MVKDTEYAADVKITIISPENEKDKVIIVTDKGHYRVLDNNETHYYQFKCIKLESAPGEKELIIAAFQNIDDIIAESEAKQKELQRALSVAKSRQSVIASVSKLFFCIYSIDIVSGKWDYLSENDPELLEGVCDRVKIMNLKYDTNKNHQKYSDYLEVTAPGSATRLFRVRTNEELMIAGDVKALARK